MATDFPLSPTIGEQFTQNNRTWEWTGTHWRSVSSTFNKATQAEAEEGTNNTNFMTPLRTQQTVDETLSSGEYVNQTYISQIGGDGLTWDSNNTVYNIDFASEAEVEAGTSSDKVLTPENTSKILQRIEQTTKIVDLTVDSNADFKATLSEEVINNQVYVLKFPVSASENVARVSFDNGSTYFNLRLDDENVTGVFVSEQKFFVIIDTANLRAHIIGGGVGGGASVIVGDAAPGDPNEGDLWFDTTSLSLFIYFNDGDSDQWVSASNTNSGTVSAEVNYYTTTISSSDWAGTEPSVAVKTVSGVLSSDRVIIDLDLSNVAFANLEDIEEQYGFIYLVETTADDEITFSAKEPLTESVVINIQVVR